MRSHAEQVPIIPMLGRWKQKDQGFKANVGLHGRFEFILGYISHFLIPKIPVENGGAHLESQHWEGGVSWSPGVRVHSLY